MGGCSDRNLAGPGSCMALSGGKRVWRDYVGVVGLLGCLVMTAIFLLNLAWICPYWPPVPPCFNPARGEQGDIPTDNEGVSYGQRRKQVTVFIIFHPKLSMEQRCEYARKSQEKCSERSTSLFYCCEIPCYHLSSTLEEQGR